jgi:TRAP-type C4-dicarboxylate transport system substrate-binding protein
MEMNLKMTSLVLVLLMFLTAAVVGCSNNSKAPAAVGDQKVIKLKFHHHNSTQSNTHQLAFVPWAKRIEERTNGKVKIDIYPQATLGKAADAYDLVTSGIVDIAWGFVGFFPNRFPLTEVVGLPMLGIETAAQGSKVVWDLFETTPYLKKEYPGVKVLFLYTHEAAVIASKKPILTASDVQGQKIRTPGGPPLTFFQSFGASPMVIATPEVYQAAEKGVIDSASYPWEAFDNINIHEIFKNVLDGKLYVGPLWLLMNQKTWDSLPPDVQKIIEEESGEKGAVFYAQSHDGPVQDIKSKFTKAGVKISQLAPDERALWQEKAKAVWDKWVADMDAKGLPGKAVLEETVKRVEKYKGQ